LDLDLVDKVIYSCNRFFEKNFFGGKYTNGWKAENLVVF